MAMIDSSRPKNSERTATRRDSRLEAATLPPGWQEKEIQLCQDQYAHFGGTDGQMFAGKDPSTVLPVTTFQLYNLPPGTKVEDRMQFRFEDQYKNGSAVLTRPLLTKNCIFDFTNKKVLGTDPGDIIGTEGKFQRELRDRYSDNSDNKILDVLWLRELFVRRLMVGIYHACAGYLVGFDTTDDTWFQSPGIQGGHIACKYLFGRTFTDEQARLSPCSAFPALELSSLHF